MTTRNRWILIVAALAAVAVIGWSLSSSDAGLAVETARIDRDSLEVTVSAEGRTRLLDRYVVAAPVPGRLERIPFEVGDAVIAGRLVARIYPMPDTPRQSGVAEAQVAAAEAQRGQAEAQRRSADAQREAAAARLELARVQARQLEREAERTRRLVEDSVLSTREGEQAELAAQTAQEEVRAADAALRSAEASVAALQASVAAGQAAVVGAQRQASGGAVVPVYAPAIGRVLRLFEESDRVVMAGTPLLEIGDAERIEVVVDVLTEDAVQIRPGARVYVDEWGGDGALRGTVQRVEPAAFTEISALGVEEQRVNVIVDLDEAPLSLGAGYRVEARIVTWSQGEVLTVPMSALFQERGVWTVFVVEGGTAQARAVRLGRRTSIDAEVLGGLEPGEDVILFPSDQIQDGVAVQSASGES
ncbi:MAG: HlyD family efflux transporter periplasmic adaptor subunit [Bacteroidota bacterium]